MLPMPTNETIIPYSRTKLTRLPLLAIGLILLGAFAFFSLPHEPLTSLVLRIVVLALLAFVVAVGFLLGTLYFRQIIKNGPGLVINNNGFTDYSSGLAAGYIPWTEVKGLKTVTLPRNKRRSISVILKNPNDFLDRQPNALKRKAMTVNFRNYGSPIQLSPNSLQCSFDELLKHLQSHFDRSRPSVLN